jgi:hypothetical protein
MYRTSNVTKYFPSVSFTASIFFKKETHIEEQAVDPND